MMKNFTYNFLNQNIFFSAKAIAVLFLLVCSSFLANAQVLKNTGTATIFVDTELPQPEVLQQAAATQHNALHLFSHGKPGQLLILYIND